MLPLAGDRRPVRRRSHRARGRHQPLHRGGRLRADRARHRADPGRRHARGRHGCGSPVVHPELGHQRRRGATRRPTPSSTGSSPRAAHVVTRTFAMARTTNVPMEGRGLVASWDRHAGELQGLAVHPEPTRDQGVRGPGARHRREPGPGGVRRRRRRLRPEDVPDPRGGGRAAGRQAGRPAGQVDRGPAGEPDRGQPGPPRRRHRHAWRSTPTATSWPPPCTSSKDVGAYPSAAAPRRAGGSWP